MAAVTGITKERMDEMDDARFVSAAVVSEVLQITRRDGTVIDCGSATGDIGPTGGPGTPDPTAIANALAAHEPGAWQPLPLNGSVVQAYDTASYGPVQYRLEKGRIRFAGWVEWIAAPLTPFSGNAYHQPISSQLPVAYAPAYDYLGGQQGYQQQQHDFRYRTDRTLNVVIHDGHSYAATQPMNINLVFPLT